MRTAKPWYRSANDTWYVCHRGQQLPLAKGKRAKREAQVAFHQLMAAAEAEAESSSHSTFPEPAPGQALLVSELLDQFLDWVKLNLDCYERYRTLFQTFIEGCGRHPRTPSSKQSCAIRQKLLRACGLSHSRKAYSEVTFRQTTDDFLRCQENAFHHFGGVPESLVIDNLRAAVSHPDWFDPELVPKLSV